MAIIHYNVHIARALYIVFPVCVAMAERLLINVLFLSLASGVRLTRSPPAI